MKEGYKKTELGMIPVDWEVKRINEVTSYVDYRGKTPEKVANGIRLITAKNIKQGWIDYDQSEEFVRESEYESIMSRGKPEIGDVLFTTEAPLGNVATIDKKEVALAQRVIKFRGNSNTLANSFLKYFMIGNLFQEMITKVSSGSTVKGIKGSILHKLPILLPPLAEQQKIATILSTVDEKIEVIAQQITATQELKKGLMQVLLTKGIGHTEFKDSPLGKIPKSWEVKTLSQFAKCTVGIASSATHAYSEQGVLLLRNQNIKEGKIALDDVLHITSEFDSIYEGKRLKTGDIISIRTGYPGISAVVPKDLAGSQTFTTLITRIIKKEFDPFFVCYFMNSEAGKLFFNNSQAGGGQKNVGSKTLEKMNIPIPPFAEQQKLRSIFELFDRKLDSLTERKSEYETLKKGLMQQLLTGNIRTI